jgi:hypothetical protein
MIVPGEVDLEHAPAAPPILSSRVRTVGDAIDDRLHEVQAQAAGLRSASGASSWGAGTERDRRAPRHSGEAKIRALTPVEQDEQPLPRAGEQLLGG